MSLLAIDPGNVKSAYVLMEYGTLKPAEVGHVDNTELLEHIQLRRDRISEIVVEMVASYGMAVGAEVFETCVMIGRILQAADERGITANRISRMEEKMHICHDSRAKDANIRRALIDRFAKHDKARGTGTKKNPDWFYGFKRDIWAAYAVGVTWIEKQKG